jgi:hypothetical protein
MKKRSQKEVIEAIRSVAESIGSGGLSQSKFIKNSDVTIRNILRYFPKWSDACREAGVKHDSSRDRVSDDDILDDWGFVTRTLKTVPSVTEYGIRGKYGRNAFKRFGSWSNVPGAFRKCFADSGAWDDVLEIVEQHSQKQKPRQTVLHPQTNRQRKGQLWHEKLASRPIYGDPIDFRGLRYEPVNEQGVVFLFGMVARELGYLVEAVQSGFPDCEAKRKISKGQWQPVKIEFEFESRNFVEHRHDPENCDVIVCWIDNWAERPPDIEVLALSEAIKGLPREDA